MATATEVNWDALLANWHADVQDLLHQIRAWSEARQWSVSTRPTTISEDHFGSYEMPMLDISSSEGKRFMVDPRYRLVFGALGRVDIIAYPSMECVMLLKKQDRWVLRSELGPIWPLEWNEETFEKVVESLVS